MLGNLPLSTHQRQNVWCTKEEENAADNTCGNKHDKGNGKDVISRLVVLFAMFNCNNRRSANANKVGNSKTENDQWDGNGYGAKRLLTQIASNKDSICCVVKH